MDKEADNIIKKASESYKRSKEEKFGNPFLEHIYQSIIPMFKLIK